MISLMFLSLALGLIIPAITGCGSDVNTKPIEEQQMPNKAISQEKHIVQGVELEVSLPPRRELAQPVELVIVLSNRSKETVYWSRTGGYRDCDVYIFDSERNHVPLTAFGEQMMGGSRRTLGIRHGSSVTTPLVPGGSHTWRIDLARVYDLTQDDYIVEVSIDLNRTTWPFTVHAEPARFQILPLDVGNTQDGSQGDAID